MAQMPSPFEQQKPIDGVDKIVAVSSGKGGVGKSTVSANLALALSQQGKKVGLLDADIYGPSIPRMFGCLDQKPEVTADNRIIPIERNGIKIMSIGFLVDEDAAIVWRGPMLFKAMEQFLRDVQWGELDYLVIDLPPGTGDVQLSLAQKVPINGAICVSTPQNISLIDVKKAVDMYDRVNIPVIGMIENMAYFRTESGEKLEMFPRGELDKFLEEKNIPKIAEIPFHKDVALGAEIGIPVVQSQKNSLEAKIFGEIASGI
ncbi:MAG: Mrp/NBP35 family ATP-binding protein [Bdellovibrionales bacterium]